MDLRVAILQIFSQVTEKSYDEVNSIPHDVSLEKYGFDSLTFIKFVVEAEQRFDIEISDDDLDVKKFGTLDIIYQTIEKYINKTDKKKPLIKCIITDCDNCLWSGIAADYGVENISVNGMHSEYQKLLVSAYEQGILLALCSKNDAQAIDDVFSVRQDMILQRNHILSERINWNHKHENISEIIRELNISSNNILYVDDDERELFWINQMLPDINTIKFDAGIVDKLKRLLFSPDLTMESSQRNQMYSEEKRRENNKRLYINKEDYYTSLETVLTFKRSDASDIPRLVELSQRTNQFNLNVTRYSKEDIESLLQNDSYEIITLTAKDIFGSLGLCAYCVIKYTDITVIIEGFMMSCRVFYRYFEDIFLQQIIMTAKKKSISKFIGLYKKTERSAKFKDFYISNGFIYEDNNFILDLQNYQYETNMKFSNCFKEIRWLN